MSQQDKDKKPGWQLFKLWGGDNRQYRFATHIVSCVCVIAVVWIIWG